MRRFPFGQSVTLHSRTVSGQDEYGDDVFTETDTTLDGIPVWPRMSSEVQQGHDTMIVGLWCVLPGDVDVYGIDEVTYSGKRWTVEGEPADLRQSPITGNGVGWQVALKRVS